MKLTESIIHYLDGWRGQYIPKDFVTSTKRGCIEGVKTGGLDYLARGPGGCLDEDLPLLPGETGRAEFYWDIWQTVLDNAIVIDPDTGLRYRLHQDDSLFLVPEHWEWNEQAEAFEKPQTEAVQP